jgi:predicted nucleic acid-binding Zn ribbon protein
MPLYQFRCEKCLYCWDEVYSVSEIDDFQEQLEKKLILCPNCKKNDVNFFFPKPSVVFKGEKGNSGFYSVDKKK